jgi:hypothetical protein
MNIRLNYFYGFSATVAQNYIGLARYQNDWVVADLSHGAQGRSKSAAEAWQTVQERGLSLLMSGVLLDFDYVQT